MFDSFQPRDMEKEIASTDYSKLVKDRCVVCDVHLREADNYFKRGNFCASCSNKTGNLKQIRKIQKQLEQKNIFSLPINMSKPKKTPQEMLFEERNSFKRKADDLLKELKDIKSITDKKDSVWINQLIREIEDIIKSSKRVIAKEMPEQERLF